jgi:hypothetical protein
LARRRRAWRRRALGSGGRARAKLVDGVLQLEHAALEELDPAEQGRRGGRGALARRRPGDEVRHETEQDEDTQQGAARAEGDQGDDDENDDDPRRSPGGFLDRGSLCVHGPK